MEPAMNLMLYLDVFLLGLLTVLLLLVSVHRALRVEKRRENELKRIEEQMGKTRRVGGAAV